jgi:hypothetical protein
MEVFGKLPYGAEIAAYGGSRKVTPLKLVQHALAKWRHMRTACDLEDGTIAVEMMKSGSPSTSVLTMPCG